MHAKGWITATIAIVALSLSACAKQAPEPAPAPKPAPKKEQPKPKPKPKPQPVKPKAERPQRDAVYFAFDSAALDAAAQATLDAWAAYLRDHPDVRVRIEGNCDERGTREYNMGLGQRRADSVKNYLVDHGVAADRMTTISYGEERPVCTEHNESCWAQNRRADIRTQ